MNKDDEHSAPKKIERKAHPDFILQAVDAMFSEVYEVSELPNDYYLGNGRVNHNKYLAWISARHQTNGTKKIRIARKVDRRDTEQLSNLIEKQIEKFLKSNEDHTLDLFRDQQLKKIQEYIDTLCPKWQEPYQNKQLRLYRDLEAYKSQLSKMVPDEATAEPKDRHPETSPFTTPKAFETFKYLCDYYPNQKKSRWTYLLHFITEESDIDPRITEAQYWEWITEHYNFDGAIKKQGGSSRKEYGKLKELHKVYLNEQV